MNRKLAFILVALLLADFTALSAYALSQHGYIGIFSHLFENSAGWQALADLSIACTLAMVWMLADARRSGRRAWPYLLLTLTAGSFGPLLYLLIGLWPAREQRSPALA
ncbi:Protein of unknown function [Solimonas aquatica]|uniref:DUF2834 domain-containing protein n=1 Tax=Solimonas aquatica TaxID=489703 RepID=A0A1H9ES88_9GAMM|nr:DUF2834 domain-containing protein [Solimonas aquatica]SEQ28571.1 Protein of unknown function [Solimonas aquatica]